MSELLEFKCPNCDGAIEFHATKQKMKCPFCDSEFEPEALLEYDRSLKSETDDQMTWETKAGKAWEDGEAEGMRLYTCNSCGGQIVGDMTTAATECPFCSNPVIVTGQLAGDLKPDLVIPFKLDKKAAMEALKRHYKGKVLLPKVFKDENRIKEIKGIYVPFWLFGAEAEGYVRYKASRTRTWGDANYNYVETSHYSVIREGSIGFENVPVDGSKKMDDVLMESIEPFDLSEAVDFQTAYLSGFFADRYDTDAKESVHRANERIKHSTQEAFRATVHGYSSVVPVSSSIKLSEGISRYALYPVWLLNTVWKDKKYTFAMNGQTGKFVGDLPCDKALFWKWLFLVFGLTSVAIFVIQYLIWLL